MTITIGFDAQPTPWYSQSDAVDLSSETCGNQPWAAVIPRLNSIAEEAFRPVQDNSGRMESGELHITQILTPRSQARCRCREIARPEPFHIHSSPAALRAPYLGPGTS
jgi:hypothetical protein